ncbi:MAG: neutral/alkaline non-lysosomal ceramidase N-terminal domain-containing protein [Planctomycetota bacterium]
MDHLQPDHHSLTRLACLFTALIGLLTGCRVSGRPLDDQPYYEETIARAREEAGASRAGSGAFRFGVGKAEVQAPVGAPLAGYGDRASAPSLGYLEPIFARALALADGNDVAVVVSTDILIINEPLEQEVMRRLQARLPDLQSHQIFICATHTHSGPGGYGRLALEELVMGRFQEYMLPLLADAISEAVLESLEDLDFGELAYAQAWAPEAISNRVGETGEVNPLVDVVACRRPGAETSAFWITYSAHPTVLPSENLYFSGDYPASLCRELEAEGEGVLALFTAGTVGGQRPSRAGRERLDACTWIGHLVSRRAREALEAARWQGEVDVRTAEVTIELPPRQVRLIPFGPLFKLPEPLGLPIVPKERSKVQLLALDRQAFYGTPCDLGWDVGEAMRLAAGERGWLLTAISHTEGYVGYCCREARFWRRGYEAQMSFFGPYMDRYFQDVLTTLLDHLPREEAGALPSHHRSFLTPRSTAIPELQAYPHHGDARSGGGR